MGQEDAAIPVHSVLRLNNELAANHAAAWDEAAIVARGVGGLCLGRAVDIVVFPLVGLPIGQTGGHEIAREVPAAGRLGKQFVGDWMSVVGPDEIQRHGFDKGLADVG